MTGTTTRRPATWFDPLPGAALQACPLAVAEIKPARPRKLAQRDQSAEHWRTIVRNELVDIGAPPALVEQLLDFIAARFAGATLYVSRADPADRAARDAQIARQAEEGRSLRAISRATGFSLTQVRRIVARAHLAPPASPVHADAAPAPFSAGKGAPLDRKVQAPSPNARPEP